MNKQTIKALKKIFTNKELTTKDKQALLLKNFKCDNKELSYK